MLYCHSKAAALEMHMAAVGGGASETRITIVLLGLKGAGISTFGNALLGYDTSASCQPSSVGFPTSPCSSDEGSTSRPKALEGSWLNTDTGKQIRVVDTPGYSSLLSNEETFKVPIFKFLKQDRHHPVVFILLKHVHALKLCSEDKMLYDAFTEMFGWNFKNYLCIIFTGFSYSDNAEQLRTRTKLSLEQIEKEVREVIELINEQVPIHAIDALYCGDNQKEVEQYRLGMDELWESIMHLLTRPTIMRDGPKQQLPRPIRIHQRRICAAEEERVRHGDDGTKAAMPGSSSGNMSAATVARNAFLTSFVGRMTTAITTAILGILAWGFTYFEWGQAYSHPTCETDQ